MTIVRADLVHQLEQSAGRQVVTGAEGHVVLRRVHDELRPTYRGGGREARRSAGWRYAVSPFDCPVDSLPVGAHVEHPGEIPADSGKRPDDLVVRAHAAAAAA